MLRTALQQAVLLRTSMQAAVVRAEQQTRGTCVVRRMYPPRLYKQGETKSLKKREYVYIVEERTDCQPYGEMDIILTQDIEGLGFAGDQMTIKKRLARNTLLPSGLAIYASPENILKYEEIRKSQQDRPRQSIWAQKTIRKLNAMNLPIPMNPKVNWTLEKTHVRVAFRNVGVILSDSCIALPSEPITEPEDITVTLTVNKLEDVSVKATVYYYYADPREAPGGILPVLPEVWMDTKVSIQDIAYEAARQRGATPLEL